MAFNATPRKREYWRWDGIGTGIGLLILIVLILYFSIYAPSWIVGIPWQGFVIVGFLVYEVLAVLAPKFVVAVLASRTGVLVTGEGVFRISESSTHPLPSIGAKVDFQKLQAAGVKIPTGMQQLVNSGHLPQPGTDEEGGALAACYVRGGGYRLSGVWYYEPGDDGFHIFLGLRPFDIGDTKRGGCLLSPSIPMAVPHDALPEAWLLKLRDDHKFKDDDPAGTGTPVYLHVEPAPGFVAGITAMKRFWEPYFNANKDNVLQRLSALSATSLWLHTEEKFNRLLAAYEELWQAFLKQGKAIHGEATQNLASYQRPDQRPAGYGRTDRIPTDPVLSQ